MFLENIVANSAEFGNRNNKTFMKAHNLTSDLLIKGQVCPTSSTSGFSNHEHFYTIHYFSVHMYVTMEAATLTPSN